MGAYMFPALPICSLPAESHEMGVGGLNWWAGGGATPWNPYLEPTYRQVRGSASSVCLVTLAFSPFFRGAATPRIGYVDQIM